MAEKQQLTFEQAMARLEMIVRKLENGEGTLDEAMALFEEGSRLAGSCSEMLEQAEQKVTMLLGEKEVPFDGAGQAGVSE